MEWNRRILKNKTIYDIWYTQESIEIQEEDTEEFCHINLTTGQKCGNETLVRACDRELREIAEFLARI